VGVQPAQPANSLTAGVRAAWSHSGTSVEHCDYFGCIYGGCGYHRMILTNITLLLHECGDGCPLCTHAGGHHRLLSLTMRPVGMTQSLYTHKHHNIQIWHCGHLPEAWRTRYPKQRALSSSMPSCAASSVGLHRPRAVGVSTLQSVLDKTVGRQNEFRIVGGNHRAI
jgi:hypothetical protein